MLLHTINSRLKKRGTILSKVLSLQIIEELYCFSKRLPLTSVVVLMMVVKRAV